MEQTLTFEQALDRLEEIVKLLEKNELPLEDALKAFEEGVGLTAFCSGKLNEAKQRIEEIEK